MTDGARPDKSRDELGWLVGGCRASQALHVAAVLGLADLLADGPRTSDELAAASDSHPDALYRLLRALASLGVLREEEDRRFALTELGDGLRTDAEGSIAGWAAFIGRPSFWQSWGALLHSVRTGENAFQHVHGTDVWSWRSDRPDESAAFDRAMEALTRGATAALVDAYDFGRFGTVVDVAGGNGTFLAALLAAFPALNGILFDQPHVVPGGERVLADAGVADRCRVVAGSFFDSVPEGGDAYVLKLIVHDWEDEEAVAILRACRAAVPDDGAVLVIERQLGPPNAAPAGKLSDLNMLVNPGGRERSHDEYAALFAHAGLRLAGVTPTAAAMDVLEAVPA